MKTTDRSLFFQKIFLLLGAMFSSCSVFSQELTELTVDRPGIADMPFAVPRKMYQLEVGFDYYRRPAGEFLNVPGMLFRTGIAKGTEVRVAAKNIVDHSDAKDYAGITPLSLGIKTGIVNQKKWIPEVDVLANLVIPTNTRADQSHQTGYEFMLLFQNDFYPNKAINYNVGYLWDNLRGKSIFSASVCFNYLPTRRIGLFIEYFDFVPDQWPGEQGIDGGMTYLITHSVQLDCSMGASILAGQNIFFASTGFSVRLSRITP